MVGAVVPGAPIRHGPGTIGTVKLVEPDRATILSEACRRTGRTRPLGSTGIDAGGSYRRAPAPAGAHRGRRVDAGERGASSRSALFRPGKHQGRPIPITPPFLTGPARYAPRGSTADHGTPIGQGPPELQDLEVPASRDVRPPHGRRREREVALQGWGDLVARDLDQPGSVPRGHDAAATGLQVAQRATNDRLAWIVHGRPGPTIESPCESLEIVREIRVIREIRPSALRPRAQG
jgi:hypothetical protein